MLFPKKKYNMWDCVRIVYSTVPVYAAVRLLSEIVKGLLPSLVVLASANFIDKAILAASGDIGRADILSAIVMFVAVLAVQRLISAATTVVNARMDQKFSCHMWIAYIDLIQPISYRYIEDPDSADMARRIRKQITQAIRNGYYSILDGVRMIISTVSILTIIVSYVWWAPIIILVLSVPLIWISYKSGKAQYETQRKNEKYFRHCWELETVMSGRESSDERALFGWMDALDGYWLDKSRTAWKKFLKFILTWSARSRLSGAVTVVASGVVIASFLPPLLGGSLSSGLFISLVGAVFNLINTFSWGVANLIDSFSWRKEYFAELTEVAGWERDPEATMPPAENPPEFESLEFRNVVFAYPGTDRKILDGMSFKMKKGKHYAIVGSNGAGKTTIAKLVTGLYSEFEGEILLNGKDIRSFPLSERKAIFSAVYQDFACYWISLRGNIELGALPNIEEADIDRAVRLSGLTDTVAELPQGLDTPLGKLDENGQDLSRGQWQRVAMARAVAGKRQFYILDEPTAALDPMAETRLYDEFAEISRGRTTVFITHRLGSVHLADEIIVLENGKTAESGSFEALMEKSGLFAEMYQAQRSWYV